MEKVHTSLLLLLTLLIVSFTLTASTNPQTPNFKNQNTKNVKKGQKDPTSIPYPYASAFAFQNMEIGEDDDKAVNGYGGPQQGYYGGYGGYPEGYGGYQGGDGGYLGGYGGYPGGYGGYPGGYGGGGPGKKPRGGGHHGYEGKGEVKGKEVNSRH